MLAFFRKKLIVAVFAGIDTLKIFLISLVVCALAAACSPKLQESDYVKSGDETATVVAPEPKDAGGEEAEGWTENQKTVVGIIAAPFVIPAVYAAHMIAGAAVLASAPIVLPAEYAVSQSNVVQPVNVVSALGTPQGAVYEKPEATFEATRTTVACSGRSNLTLADKVVLTCNKKKTATLTFERLTTRVATVFVGPVLFRDPETGEIAERLLECRGPFNMSGNQVHPFALTCARGGGAVIIPGAPDAENFWSLRFLFTPPG